MGLSLLYSGHDSTSIQVHGRSPFVGKIWKRLVVEVHFSPGIFGVDSYWIRGYIRGVYKGMGWGMIRVSSRGMIRVTISKIQINSRYFQWSEKGTLTAQSHKKITLPVIVILLRGRVTAFKALGILF